MSMRKEKIGIKKTIAKKIEFRHKQVAFIKNSENTDEIKAKRQAFEISEKKRMDELDRLRIYGDGKKPIDVSLMSRDEMRTGIKISNEENPNIYKPILADKKPISIIISAYQTQDYIEECLDSIEIQTYFINNNDYEILIGVDNCEKTLNKLTNIRFKYRNLRIFMMKSNEGTYVTSNTLLNLVRYDNILRFDSDDIMKPEMINEIMYFIDEYDIIQFLFSDFTDDINKYSNNFKYVAAGAHFYKNSVIEIAGGYRDWRCAADSEFIKRMTEFVKIKKINKRLFYRRYHASSITNKKETNENSEIRKSYLKKIRVYNIKENVKIEKKINIFIEK